MFLQLFPYVTLSKAPESALLLPLRAANRSFLSNELNHAGSDEPLEVLGLEAFRPCCVISNSWSPILKSRPKGIVQVREYIGKKSL